ncbi:hypothetical protein CR513_35301, partial [Mucuna pruriens]
MGSIKREKRVLKLVHPGRHIEVHRKPIRAAEVLRKNPRHCITRPDVFMFPWIVVKPESVLLPGSVFLIVPNHTIYDLLKATTAQSTQSQSPFSQPPKNHAHQQFKQDSHDMENVSKHDWGEGSQNQSYADTSSFEFRPYHQALKYYQNYSNSDIEAEMLGLKKDVNLEFVSSEQVTMLKSCLRRPDSTHKKLNLNHK